MIIYFICVNAFLKSWFVWSLHRIISSGSDNLACRSLFLIIYGEILTIGLMCFLSILRFSKAIDNFQFHGGMQAAFVMSRAITSLVHRKSEGLTDIPIVLK